MSETVITMNHSNHPQNDPASLNWLKFNFDYFKTNEGVLKIIQIALSIVCMALSSPAYFNGTHFFLFAIVLTFICTVMWSFAYFLGIRDVLQLPINWTLSEFVNYVIATFMLFLAFIIQISTWIGRNNVGQGRNIAAGVVGIIDTIFYAQTARLLYIQYKFERNS